MGKSIAPAILRKLREAIRTEVRIRRMLKDQEAAEKQKKARLTYASRLRKFIEWVKNH